MRAAWWWVDRWQRSTAFKDMTLAEQGAYRNLLDELWLRSGVLPADERVLARLCGDALEWPKVRKAVLQRFRLTDEGYRNDTHDEVSGESQRRAEKQRKYRNGRGNAAGNGGGDEHADPPGNYGGDVRSNVTPSPDPSPDQSLVSGSVPPPPPQGGASSTSEKRALRRADLKGTALDSEAFFAAWSDWEKVHGKYKPLGLKGQMTRIAAWGHDRAVAAVRYSIAQESRGVYEEHGRNGHVSSGVHKTHAESALDEWVRKTAIQ